MEGEASYTVDFVFPHKCKCDIPDIPLFDKFLQGTLESEKTIYSSPSHKTTFHHTGNGICKWHGISEYLHNKRGW